jgi:hypothetical protein
MLRGRQDSNGNCVNPRQSLFRETIRTWHPRNAESWFHWPRHVALLQLQAVIGVPFLASPKKRKEPDVGMAKRILRIISTLVGFWRTITRFSASIEQATVQFLEIVRSRDITRSPSSYECVKNKGVKLPTNWTPRCHKENGAVQRTILLMVEFCPDGLEGPMIQIVRNL